MGKNKLPKKPFVSVCTPTFNRRPFIPFMIKCFENQTYPKDKLEWIIVDDGTDSIEDLVTCVHIIQLKLLTAMRVGHKQKKIDINIPKLDDFIHKAYIGVARKVYKNVYLFEVNVPPLQVQKNYRELEIIVQECILNAVRESIPIESILRAYMDETVEEDVVEEIKEQVIEKSAPVNARGESEFIAEVKAKDKAEASALETAKSTEEKTNSMSNSNSNNSSNNNNNTTTNTNTTTHTTISRSHTNNTSTTHANTNTNTNTTTNRVFIFVTPRSEY